MNSVVAFKEELNQPVDITKMAKQAADAAKSLSMLSTEEKNRVLNAMADAIAEQKDLIVEVNKKEVAEAKKQDLDEAFIDRLVLDSERIDDMVSGMREIVELEDPVGMMRPLNDPPSGIKVNKVRVPLGVICMIYEARPNVTADASALCFKSGNAIILRGGKEALQTSLAIASIMRAQLEKMGLPKAAVTVIPDAARELMTDLMEQDQYIDVIIPRGGEGLIRYVTKNSKIPVIQHFKGVCHLYVDAEADLAMAEQLLINGKTHRTGVCNALECVLVHRAVAEKFLPKVAAMSKEKGVAIHCSKDAASYFESPDILDDEDFGVEYLSSQIAVRIVDDFDAAVAHIDQFGSQHTEVICTANQKTAETFQRRIDASVVMANASSRFSDGGQLGLGAEIGIATTKLHAYGPMGLESLTTEKFVVTGEGEVRQ